jgi:putative phosphoserine phosphatase/1-acylglycerol-3-phosphate O-acyltransferase
MEKKSDENEKKSDENEKKSDENEKKSDENEKKSDENEKKSDEIPFSKERNFRFKRYDGIQSFLDMEFQNQLYDLLEDKSHFDLSMKNAEKYANEIYAIHDKFADGIGLNFFKSILDLGFDKKIDTDFKKLTEIMELMKRKSVAFVTSHKSYLDLIVLPVLLGKYDIPFPYIISGINLNLPVFGDLIKKTGTIFIRRNNSDDKIYKLVLKRYFSFLISQKKHFTWAIEGTRSRSGKILPPKLGMLKYLYEQDITYIPVSILYDINPDVNDLSVETQNGEKHKETFEWCVTYFKNLCKEKKGKIYVRFGNFIEKDVSQENSFIVLGEKLIREINTVTPISFISLVCIVLLSKISISENNLIYYVNKLKGMVDKNLLMEQTTSIHNTVQKSLDLLIRNGIVRRYKNILTCNYDKYYCAYYYANTSLFHFTQYAFDEFSKDLQRDFRDFFSFPCFSAFLHSYSKSSKIANPKSHTLTKNQNSVKSEKKKFYFSPIIFGPYIDAYKIIEETFRKTGEVELEKIIFFSEEIKWKYNRPPLFTPILKEVLENFLKIHQKQNFNKNLSNYADEIERMTKINRTSDTKEYIVKNLCDYSLVKHIYSTEKGKHICAFFDFDNTIIKGFSIYPFITKILLSGKLRHIDSKNLLSGLTNTWNKYNFEEILKKIATTLKGLKEKDFIEIGEESSKELMIFEEIKELINAHRVMNHEIVIISSATKYQIESIAKKLGIQNIECTQFETLDGIFTGKLKFSCFGEGKVEAAKKYQTDFSKSFFYTDSYDDIKLLNLVGNPQPVNPDIKLLDFSYKNNWELKFFDEGKENDYEHILRTFFAYLTAIPVSLKGYTEGGKYGALLAIADLATSMGGIMIDVKNEEKCWKIRPAVFIFNHQSHFDTIVAIKLLKKDGIGIAKKEIRNYPIIGDLLDQAGTVFIDTEKKGEAIEMLKPVVEEIKKGLSLVIFPEGTRSFNKQLGNFKKGAFHIAMQAKVPLIPVVIHNSHDIMPRGTSVLLPGIVNVTVLNPIDISNWTLENMNSKIVQVRNLFLKELGQL